MLLWNCRSRQGGDLWSPVWRGYKKIRLSYESLLFRKYQKKHLGERSEKNDFRWWFLERQWSSSELTETIAFSNHSIGSRRFKFGWSVHCTHFTRTFDVTSGTTFSRFLFLCKSKKRLQPFFLKEKNFALKSFIRWPIFWILMSMEWCSAMRKKLQRSNLYAALLKLFPLVSYWL